MSNLIKPRILSAGASDQVGGKTIYFFYRLRI
jgi:NAD(P)H dehydrogenase (quinone)